MLGQYFTTSTLERVVKFLQPLRSRRVRDEQRGSMSHRASSVTACAGGHY